MDNTRKNLKGTKSRPWSSRRVKSMVSGGIAIKEASIRVVPSKVFAALTKPTRLNTWFTSGAKVDLRIGGRYTNKDKDTGSFLEIVRNKRLRFTWDNPNHAPGTMVEIVLTRANRYNCFAIAPWF